MKERAGRRCTRHKPDDSGIQETGENKQRSLLSTGTQKLGRSSIKTEIQGIKDKREKRNEETDFRVITEKMEDNSQFCRPTTTARAARNQARVVQSRHAGEGTV